MTDFRRIPVHMVPSECGDNAKKWALAFRQMILDRNKPVTEGLMIAWFANAIETACDKRAALTE